MHVLITSGAIKRGVQLPAGPWLEAPRELGPGPSGGCIAQGDEELGGWNTGRIFSSTRSRDTAQEVYISIFIFTI